MIITIKFRSCPSNVYNIDSIIPLYLYVIMNADKEKPKIKPLRYNRNILNNIPIMVNPNIHIIKE